MSKAYWIPWDEARDIVVEPVVADDGYTGALSYDRVKAWVGGLPETVRVLFQDRPALMFVNESGLADGMPRNNRATEIYRAATRKLFPHAADPFEEAQREFVERLRSTAGVSFARVDLGRKYWADDGPYIAGDVVVLDMEGQ